MRQKEGFGAIINGQKEIKIKYTVDGLKSTDEFLNASKNKIFKIADGGTDDITKVTVEKITKIN